MNLVLYGLALVGSRIKIPLWSERVGMIVAVNCFLTFSSLNKLPMICVIMTSNLGGLKKQKGSHLPQFYQDRTFKAVKACT